MKAIVLLSGGLDSSLAVKVLQAQGIDVVGLNFISPFHGSFPEQLRASLNIPIKTVPLGKAYYRLLKSPRFGFGRNCNPCIDCHIHMLQVAKSLLKRLGAQFVATGEVLEQRPMSQRRATLTLIEGESGLGGLLVRPLSARLLDETLPEKKGWIERRKLLAISGRGRKDQMQLAAHYGLTGFTQPAGGCLLTNPSFSIRLRDLMKHEGLHEDDIRLLRVGRHLRLSKKSKFIVGRDQHENQTLEGIARGSDYLFFTPDTPGPVGLHKGPLTKETIEFCCRIIAYYADQKDSAVKVVYFQKRSLRRRSCESAALGKEEIERLRLS